MRIAVIFRGNLRDCDRNEEKFNLVIKSIFKAFDTKNIDFYMHLWGDENEKNIYQNVVKFEKILIEKNKNYYNKIDKIVKKHNTNYYNQVSSALSISKVCELVQGNSSIKYDFIFITRPDLAFTEKILISNISDDTIYFNEHGDCIKSGDYCFLLSQNNLNLFKNIFSYLRDSENIAQTHVWIYDYLNNYCKKNIELLNIRVGKNCEIFKHIENFPYPDIKIKILNFINN